MPLDAQPLGLLVEGGSVDAEGLGRGIPPPAVTPEGVENQLPLRCGEPLTEGVWGGVRLGCHRLVVWLLPPRPTRQHRSRQIDRADQPAVAQERRPLDGMEQLTDVAGPIVGLKAVDSGIA
jgi:hypothetical protein